MNTIALPVRMRRLRAGAALLVAGLLAAGLAGCGEEVGANASKPPTKVTKTYNKCMSDAGYPQVADGTVGEPGKDPLWKDEGFTAARQWCSSTSGVNGYGPRYPKSNRKVVDRRIRAMTKCLRDKGWDLKDPERGTHGALYLDTPRLDSGKKKRAHKADFTACTKKVRAQLSNHDKNVGGDPGDDGHEHDGHDHGDHSHER